MRFCVSVTMRFIDGAPQEIVRISSRSHFVQKTLLKKVFCRILSRACQVQKLAAQPQLCPKTTKITENQLETNDF